MRLEPVFYTHYTNVLMNFTTLKAISNNLLVSKVIKSIFILVNNIFFFLSLLGSHDHPVSQASLHPSLSKAVFLHSGPSPDDQHPFLWHLLNAFLVFPKVFFLLDSALSLHLEADFGFSKHDQAIYPFVVTTHQIYHPWLDHKFSTKLFFFRHN